MGIDLRGVVPIRALPNWVGPLSFLKFSSDSAERTAPFAFQEPDFRFGLFPDTRGSLESLSSRRPLILQDLKIDVRLFIGKGHGDDEV